MNFYAAKILGFNQQLAFVKSLLKAWKLERDQQCSRLEQKIKELTAWSASEVMKLARYKDTLAEMVASDLSVPAKNLDKMLAEVHSVLYKTSGHPEQFHGESADVARKEREIVKDIYQALANIKSGEKANKANTQFSELVDAFGKAVLTQCGTMSVLIADIEELFADLIPQVLKNRFSALTVAERREFDAVAQGYQVRGSAFLAYDADIRSPEAPEIEVRGYLGLTNPDRLEAMLVADGKSMIEKEGPGERGPVKVYRPLLEPMNPGTIRLQGLTEQGKDMLRQFQSVILTFNASNGEKDTRFMELEDQLKQKNPIAAEKLENNEARLAAYNQLAERLNTLAEEIIKAAAANQAMPERMVGIAM